MVRLARPMRLLGGVLLFLNIVFVFTPLLRIINDNYPEKLYSQFYFIKGVFSASLKGNQILFAICFVCIPTLVSLICGIIGIVGEERQIVSPIGGLFAGGLYIGFFFLLESIVGQKTYDEIVYDRTIWLTIMLIFNIVIVVISFIALISTPKKIKHGNEDASVIDDFDHYKMEQQKPKVEFIDEAELMKNREKSMSVDMQTGNQIPPDVNQSQFNNNENVDSQDAENKEVVQEEVSIPEWDGITRGEIVGLSGMYTGAVIQLNPGEVITLGRDKSNSLVFEGQPRISRCHCRLAWDENSKNYTIFDTSSNGSFINDSDECVPQNMPITLYPGMILHLGSNDNSFRLQ